MKAIVKKLHQLNDIPSASGIEIINKRIFIIGDDTGFLFEIDNHGSILNKIPLSENPIQGRIPKAEKPDYEAMTLLEINTEAHLLIIGSGSLSPQRDKGVLVRLSDYHVENLELNGFYKLLKAELGPDDRTTFNLEGLCTVGEDLIFAQRGGITGNQILFRISIKDFLMFCNEEKSNPALNTFQFSLPKVDGVPYGISGCTIDKSKEHLFFCASAEDTKNTYDDGDIKGSLLGSIEMIKGKERVIKFCEIENQIGKVQFKMESLAILDEDHGVKYDLLGVCDNDDGTSLLLEIELVL